MNSKNRKIVFFDIDGTIVDGATHTIPESTVEAIRRLRANGHLAFLNTGRTMASIEREFWTSVLTVMCADAARTFIMRERRFIPEASPMKNVWRSFTS